MSTPANPLNKPSRRHELREDTVVTLYARALDFYHKNSKALLIGLSVLGVLVLGLVGFFIAKQYQERKAQEQLAEILPTYESNKLQEAINGVPGKPGLKRIADSYGITKAGNLARFYVADAYYRLGDNDKALDYFEDYDKDEDFVGASAYAGEAAVYENKKNFKKAAELYLRAADTFENELTSPLYMLDAARAYEQVGDYAGARDTYNDILEQFPKTELANAIDFYMARLDAMESGK